MPEIIHKKCTGCRQSKPTDAFYPRGENKTKFRSRCKECLDTAFRQKYGENPDLKKIRAARYQKYKDIHRDNVLKWHYGISLVQYNEMLAAQNHCCAICKTHEKEFTRRLSVDHCHETNAVRQLLCGKCNAGLGNFQESEAFLSAAIEYLRHHKKFKLIKGAK